MENIALREGETFQQAKDRIARQVLDEIASDPRSLTLDNQLKELDSLRKDGLFAAREAREKIDRLNADHKLSIRRTRLAEKLAEKARERESKRQVVALKFAIHDREEELKLDTRKELKREASYISLVTDKATEDNPDFIRSFTDDLPLSVKGLDILTSLTDDSLNARIQELNDVKARVSDLRLKSRTHTDDESVRLKAKVDYLSACGRVERLTEELKALKRFKDRYAGLTSRKGSKYFVALVKLCLEVYIFSAESDIRNMKAELKASTARIKGQYRIDAERLRIEASARLESIESDPEFHSSIAELKAGLARAKEQQRRVQKRANVIADAAWDTAHAIYSEKRSAIFNKRRETRIYFNGYMKRFSAEHRKDKAALSAEAETIYRQLALGGVAEDAVVNSMRETYRRISATVREARKPHVDRDIINYYQPEEVIKDPTLVDVANMRLVVRGADKQVDVKAVERRDAIFKGIYLFFIYLFLCICAITVLFPFYWMINTSLKSTEEIINSITPTLWPKTVMWSNYVDVFQRFDFFTYLVNTLVVGIFSTIGVLLTCILSAFAFARLKFRGRDTLFMVFLATMMIPGEMMVITNYITVSNFGWIGSNAGRIQAYMAMVFPFCVSVFYIYLLRQNFKQIPEELYLAAKVDGKSDWSFLWKVMVPLCRPTLITIGILELMGSWNAYVWPNLVANKAEFRLISNGLRDSFTTSSGVAEYGLQMAATVYVTLPLLLLFIFFRKYIMKGMGRAGIKG